MIDDSPMDEFLDDVGARPASEGDLNAPGRAAMSK
jgi:hypothetical protein